MSEIEQTPESHDEEVPHIHMRTAFMVIVDATGKATAITQAPPGVIVDFAPDPRAIKAACIEIADDIQAKSSADYVINTLAAQREQERKTAELAEKPSSAVVEGFKRRKGKKA